MRVSAPLPRGHTFPACATLRLCWEPISKRYWDSQISKNIDSFVGSDLRVPIFFCNIFSIFLPICHIFYIFVVNCTYIKTIVMVAKSTYLTRNLQKFNGGGGFYVL